MEIPELRRNEALNVLEHLCRHLRAITADIFFAGLLRKGFTQAEVCRLTGGIMRTGSAKGWIAKTGHSMNSKKNRSNLQNVWASRIFGKASHGGQIRDEKIAEEYEKWKDAGIQEAHEIAIFWEWVESFRKNIPDLKI